MRAAKALGLPWEAITGGVGIETRHLVALEGVDPGQAFRSDEQLQ